MLRQLLVGSIILVSTCVWGQQTPRDELGTGHERSAVKGLPIDPAALSKVIEGSYYHPDNLKAMECDLSVDWDEFMHTLRTPVPDARMQAMKGLKIHELALRGKPVVVNFDWTNGTIATKDQVEGGLKQMLDGFYQMYWSMLAGPLLGQSDRLGDIASLPGGGAKVLDTSGGTRIQFILDQEGAPTHYDFDAGAMKAAVDLKYIPSPKPFPGDLRRIEEMNLDETIGESRMKVDMKVGYQEVSNFNIPRDVSFSILGAYTVDLTFFNCKASAVAVSQ